MDSLARQVMQASAVNLVPMPPVTAGYLLQLHRPAVDAAPVLGRLVNMQFPRRDAGRYHLHRVDRDYALSRIPDGNPPNGVPTRRRSPLATTLCSTIDNFGDEEVQHIDEQQRSAVGAGRRSRPLMHACPTTQTREAVGHSASREPSGLSSAHDLRAES